MIRGEGQLFRRRWPKPTCCFPCCDGSAGDVTREQCGAYLRRLAAQKGLKDVRFFGKVVGLRADYYVVESAHWYPDKDHKNYRERHSVPRVAQCCGFARCGAHMAQIGEGPGGIWGPGPRK